MKILIVSGFLGAGKTTFIKMMSKKTGRDFCVFENEYAQTDFDKMLLSQEDNLDIWELTENCICCSGKQDFASSILTISNTIDPEYLIVEPTGVAKLSAILQNIQRIAYDRISLLKPITILDGTNMERQLKEYPDICLDQLQNAEQIVLSKMEQADQKERSRVREQIKARNPSAKVVEEHYSSQPLSWWEGLLQEGIHGEWMPIENKEAETSMENLTLRQVLLPSIPHLISFLEMVVFGVFGTICRAKGFLPCGSEWVQFEVVDRTYSITGMEKQDTAEAVFIGTHLYRGGLRELLQPKTVRESRKQGLVRPVRR